MIVQPGSGMPLVLRGGNQNSASMMCTAVAQRVGRWVQWVGLLKGCD